MKCSQCGHDNPKRSGFCMHCGSPMDTSSKLVCRSCSTENPDGSAFCMSCGSQLGQQPAHADTNTATHTKPKPTRNRRIGLIAAVLSGIVLLAVILILASGIEPTPTEVATQFFAAMDSQDWDTLIDLLHSDARELLESIDPTDLHGAARYYYSYSGIPVTSVLDRTILGEVYREDDEAVVGYTLSYFGLGEVPLMMLLFKEHGKWKVLDHNMK